MGGHGRYVLCNKGMVGPQESIRVTKRHQMLGNISGRTPVTHCSCFCNRHYYAYNLPIATGVRDLRSKDVKPLLGIVPPSGSC